MALWPTPPDWLSLSTSGFDSVDDDFIVDLTVKEYYKNTHIKIITCIKFTNWRFYKQKLIHHTINRINRAMKQVLLSLFPEYRFKQIDRLYQDTFVTCASFV
ncbi:hypothetical protein GCM10027185_37750 [Spirosoma pulveris]